MAYWRVLPIVSAVALSAFLAACETPAPPPPAPIRAAAPPPPPPTPLDEFAWSARPGANSLLGAIQYRPAANQTWTCAGQSVALTPETSYSRSRMSTLYGSADRALQTVAAVRTRSAANPGLDYSKFVQTTTCDAQDSFAFNQLPDGAYFIIARVRQSRPAGATGDGMVIMQRVELKGGASVRVILPQGSAPAPTAPPAAPTRR